MDPNRKVIIRTPAERRVNILPEMKNLTVAQQERMNRRQVHALKIESAYQDVHSAAINEMSLIELNIRRKDLEKHHTEFEKEHKALVTTLREENFKIATDTANIIDKMHLKTLIKYETKLFELLKADEEKSRKKLKKNSKKLKEIEEVPEKPKKRKKAELMKECFGSSSEDESENKRRKLQEKPCTITSMKIEEPQTITQTAPTTESTPTHVEEVLELTTETELDQVSDEEPVTSTKNVPNMQSTVTQPDLRNQLNDYRAEQSENYRAEQRTNYTSEIPRETTRSRSLRCYYCNGNHPMSDCGEFKNLNVPARRQEVDRLGLCKNCFAPMNSYGRIHRCTKGPCFRCRKGLYHNSLTCLMPPGTRQFH